MAGEIGLGKVHESLMANIANPLNAALYGTSEFAIGPDIREIRDVVVGDIKKIIKKQELKDVKEGKMMKDFFKSSSKSKDFNTDMSSFIKKTDASMLKLVNAVTMISGKLNEISKKSSMGSVITKLEGKDAKEFTEKFMKQTKKGGMFDTLNNFLDMAAKLQNISLKGLALAKPKIAMIKNIFDDFKALADPKKLSKDELVRMSRFVDFIDNLVGKLTKMTITVRLVNRFKTVNKLKKLILGADGTGTTDGIVHLMNALKDREMDIKQANKTMVFLDAAIWQLNLTLLGVILLGPLAVVATAAALLANLCLGERGPIMKLFKNIAENKKTLAEGALGMGCIFIGMAFMALSMIMLHKGVKDLTVGDVLLGGASMFMMYYITKVAGKDLPSVAKGAVAMAIMGVGLIPFSIAIKKMGEAVKGMKWKELGMLGTLMVGLVGSIIAVGALVFGPQALVWAAGVAALGTAGLAVLPFAEAISKAKDISKTTVDSLKYALKEIPSALVTGASKSAKKEARDKIKILKDITKVMTPLSRALSRMKDFKPQLVDDVITGMDKLLKFFMGEEKDAGKKTGNAFDMIKGKIESKLNDNSRISALSSIVKILNPMANAFKKFNKVAPDSVDKVIDILTKLNDFFFKEGGMKISKDEKKEAKNTASALKEISDVLGKMAKSLTKFNKVGPDSVDKMKATIASVADFFFGESNLFKNVGRKDRRNAKSNADAIGQIGDSLHDFAKSMEIFNKLGANAGEKTKTIISNLVEYLFKDMSKEQKKTAKKNASFLEDIGDDLADFAESLQKFSEFGEEDVDKTIRCIDKLNTEMTSITISDDIDKKMKSLEKLANKFSDINHLFADLGDAQSPSSGFTELIGKVNEVQLPNVNALTEMLKAFAEINKSRANIFSRMDDNVKKFTKACVELIDAINGNTNAISSENEETEASPVDQTAQASAGPVSTSKPKGKPVQIENMEELAKLIAKEMSGSISLDNTSTINLRINGEDGYEWRISRS